MENLLNKVATAELSLHPNNLMFKVVEACQYTRQNTWWNLLHNRVLKSLERAPKEI